MTLKNIIVVFITVGIGIFLWFVVTLWGTIFIFGFDNTNPSFGQKFVVNAVLIIAILVSAGLNWLVSKNWKIALITLVILTSLYLRLFGIKLLPE